MLNLFWPKFFVISVIVLYSLVKGFTKAKESCLHPTLGDCIVGAWRSSPFLLVLGIGFVLIL